MIQFSPMQVDAPLKKSIRAVDLALQAARKRQSPRTGFVHHYGGGEGSDTIPIYENFCFVLALYRQKTVEAALEGREILEKLLAFQAAEGTFPVYLHEYPRCRDRKQSFRIASVLIQLLRHFGSVLSIDLKQKISETLQKLLPLTGAENSSSSKKELCNQELFSSAEEWAEHLIETQAAGEQPCSDLSALYDPKIGAFLGGLQSDLQEGFEPKPHLIEWLLAEREGLFSDRLLKDHPLQLQLAAFWPLSIPAQLQEGQVFTEQGSLSFIPPGAPSKKWANLFRFLWQGKTLHSFVLPQLTAKTAIMMGDEGDMHLLFDLPREVDLSRNDLYEISFYCDASPEVELFINQKKGTVFQLGDWVQIRTPERSFELSFELIAGEGRFLGHFSRANRPSQIGVKQYEAYDWRIGMRTLTRSSEAQIRVRWRLLIDRGPPGFEAIGYLRRVP